MADAVIRIDVESRGADRFFRDVEQKSRQASRQIEDVDSSFNALSRSALAAGAALAGIGAGFGFAINAAINIENLTTSFISFTGSAESAQEQLQRLTDFSARTPFQLETLAEANRTLLAFGSSTEESLIQLEQLGNVAAATGKDIGELATIFGQIQAEGRLTGERFNQLIERGINIGPALAESLGVAETSIRGLISQSRISADEVAAAFATITGEGGQFAGSIERQSKTLSGSLSTLRDNVNSLAASFGAQLTPTIVEYANGLTAAIQLTQDFFGSLSRNEALTENQRAIQSLNLQLEALVERRQELIDEGPGFLDKIFGGSTAGLVIETEGRIRAVREELQKLQELEDLRAAQGQFESERAAQLKAEQAAIEENLAKQREAAEQERVIAEQRAENVQKIEEQITQIRQQEEAVRRALRLEQAQVDNQAEIDLLLERELLLAEKRLELEAQQLEAQGQFDEALTKQVVDAEAIRQERKAQEATKGEQKRLAAIRQAQQDEFDFQKLSSEAQIKFDEQTYAERVQTANRGLSALSSLQRSGSRDAFAIGKAAALAQAAVSIPTTAIEAYKSLAGIPIVGPALGAAAAAAAIVAGTQQLNRIKSTQFTAFAEGGRVPEGFNNDTFPALLSSGEVVVPERNFEQILSGETDFRNSEQAAILRSINFGINRLIELTNIVINTIQNVEFQGGGSSGRNDADFIDNLLNELGRNQAVVVDQTQPGTSQPQGGVRAGGGRIQPRSAV